VHARRARNRAAEFRNNAAQGSLQASAAAVCDSRLDYCAGQVASEITAFLEWARESSPRVIGEIGSARGGNLFLFSLILPPGGRLVSVEFIDDHLLRATYRGLVGPGKRLRCIAGDSHDSATLNRVRRALGRGRFDLLFIDGDHSYEGVKADFEMYAPLVRPGGVVAFHDIVADVFQRYGRPTPSDTGGVPIFWKELKARHPDHREFIENPEQDGFGVGAIRWPGAH
jgi:predicted O-methyltransferase YrrM